MEKHELRGTCCRNRRKGPEITPVVTIRSLLLLALLLLMLPVEAQFYNGSHQEFGKNRVQYRDFRWQTYRFDDMDVHFYPEGRDVAQYAAMSAMHNRKDLEKFFDFKLEDRVHLVVYNSLTDFRQSNVGLAAADAQHNVGGVTRIIGNKVFVYFEGDHALLDQQVRAGLAQLILEQLLHGGNWREAMRNNSLTGMSEWYTKGVVGFSAGPWDARGEARLRDGILSGRYDRLDRLQGEDAALMGQALWQYVNDVYGAAVIPNVLYMTRVTRNPDSGFLYVLGVSLKTLTSDCLAYYRTRFSEADGRRSDPATTEEIKVRTKRNTTYAQFKLSPTGTHAAWTSNELGQYKVWLHERGTGKTRRILKGEKKIARIIDGSYPVLAWHPTGRALSWITERKGVLLFTTYTLDDRKKIVKEIFDMDKVLSMDYAPDGRTMVFSGVRQGRTDLYLYHVIGNRQERLTDDQYDDLDPAFVDGGKGIIFTSDRYDDTLRTSGPVEYYRGQKDVFVYDLGSRSRVLRRVTDTPDADERQPMAYSGSAYTYLTDRDRLMDRWVAVLDSTIIAVDTVVHYGRFSREKRLTNTKRGILEQHLQAGRGYYSQLVLDKGRYRFQVGRTAVLQALAEPSSATTDPHADTTAGAQRGTLSVTKVDVRRRRATEGSAIDIADYRFLDDPAPIAQDPGAAPQEATPSARSAPASSTVGAPVGGKRPMGILMQRPQFPEQRTYNVNFATEEVVTQLDNRYDAQFYQPRSGAGSLNPGLSGLTRMAAADLFEDYRITGGFRLALDLNNNTYMLRYANMRKRLDKEFTFYRQALQGIDEIGIVKLHSHSANYRVSWPFSELASLRGSVFYRNDRYVLRSIDGMSLRTPNVYDHMAGVKVEYVYDSSTPLGLNLYTGWKLKVFGEYYKEPDGRRTDMAVVGFDIRNSMRLHRELIWVNRLAGSTSVGSRQVLFFLGGVDNWMFAKVEDNMPIDPSRNYWYQAQGVPMRGFAYNARNGSAFAVYNTEVRLPVFRYLMDRPVRSDFFQNFQVVGFADVGTAWTGAGPYADDNYFNVRSIRRNPFLIELKNLQEPIIASYGFGLRSRLLGYFVRADWAWGVNDGVIQKGMFHFSLSLDI